MEEVFLLLINVDPIDAPTFEHLQEKFSRNASAQVAQKVPFLLEALRELLRIAPAASRCALTDFELKEAIRERYESGTIQQVRAEEARLKAQEAELRKSQLQSCVATVQEQHNGLETGCSSLHQAVNAAASGDEVILHKKHVNLKSGLMINRNLKISSKHADAVIEIKYGQTILQIGDDELHRIEPQERFTVTVVDVKMKQFGFEAAEVPYCVRVSANSELHLSNCQVTSDVAIGILVADGLLTMEDSQTVLCGGQVRADECCCFVKKRLTGMPMHAQKVSFSPLLLTVRTIRQGLMVQEKGRANLDRCQVVANWLPNISEAEKEMHEMFIAFCKGETAAR